MDVQKIKLFGTYVMAALVGGVVGYYICAQKHERRLGLDFGIEEEDIPSDWEYEEVPYSEQPETMKDADIILKGNMSKAELDDALETKRIPVSNFVVTRYDKPDLKELVKEPSPEPMEFVVVPPESFSSKPKNFTELTLYYWEGDDTFSDDNDDIVADWQLQAGPNVKAHFGELSDDPDVVYIRNNRMKTSVEVIRRKGKYSTIVMGLPEEKEEKSKRRKPKSKVNNEEDEV